MANEELAPIATSFWTNDEGWQIGWPAALLLAVVVHAFAFMGAAKTPPKKIEPRIEMAIAMPPPPPEPPPPEPEPEKPKPKPKVPPPDLPPPPNETPPPEAAPTEVQPVTGVTADSVVGENASGMNVRVGNTTFGNPNDEPLVKPQDVQAIVGPAFDISAYRKTVFDILNREKRYPRKAKVLQLQGRCVVNLALNRDGTLAEPPKLLGKGTGHPVLDEECLRMANSVKYPPILGEVTELPVRVRQPIEFTILDP
ncbi:MAG: TonB family protein [Deltaproteobacteria bacterium]|nr:TonB family protein [Deltaproteobacteria bacterium]